MSQQEMETNQLTTIIQTIQRARRTGLLSVRRVSSAHEEGTILFVNGRVTESHVGPQKGKDAYNTLCLWGTCLFTFISSNPHDKPLVFPITQEPSASPGSRTDALRLSPPPVPPTVSMSPSLRPQQPPALDQQFSPGQPVHFGLSSFAIPYQRLSSDTAIQVMDRRGFPRSYRQVFLLINGQRSFEELIRLLARPPEVVENILLEMEQAALIGIKR